MLDSEKVIRDVLTSPKDFSGSPTQTLLLLYLWNRVTDESAVVVRTMMEISQDLGLSYSATKLAAKALERDNMLEITLAPAKPTSFRMIYQLEG